MFSIYSVVCVIVWGNLQHAFLVQHTCEPKHLLGALVFLKIYAAEYSLALTFGVDEKTLHKWMWIIVFAISDLEDDCVSL